MLPKFANPHSLSQDAEIITRSEVAKQVGCTRVVDDEESHSLKRDLDNLLQDTWADVLAHTFSPPKAKKRRKTAENRTEDSQLGRDPAPGNGASLVFRLVSSMKRPQYISLDTKPLPPPVYDPFHPQPIK